MSDRADSPPPTEPKPADGEPGGVADEGAQQPAAADPGAATHEGGAPDPGAASPQFGERPPVTVDMPLPGFEETRVTEALADKKRIQRQIQRVKRRAYVRVHRADNPSARIDMERGELVFGRDPADCDIILQGPEVSRTHARIVRDDLGYYCLLDCKSRNGTYVDGQPIREMNLCAGDRFEIGDNEIEFCLED